MFIFIYSDLSNIVDYGTLIGLPRLAASELWPLQRREVTWKAHVGQPECTNGAWRVETGGGGRSKIE